MFLLFILIYFKTCIAKGSLENARVRMDCAARYFLTRWTIHRTIILKYLYEKNLCYRTAHLSCCGGPQYFFVCTTAPLVPVCFCIFYCLSVFENLVTLRCSFRHSGLMHFNLQLLSRFMKNLILLWKSTRVPLYCTAFPTLKFLLFAAL